MAANILGTLSAKMIANKMDKCIYRRWLRRVIAGLDSLFRIELFVLVSTGAWDNGKRAELLLLDCWFRGVLLASFMSFFDV